MRQCGGRGSPEVCREPLSAVLVSFAQKKLTVVNILRSSDHEMKTNAISDSANKIVCELGG